MEKEARVEISLENRFKEALRKAKEVIGYVKERNDGCEPSVAECLAYDMQYVEKYVKQLVEENNNYKAAALKNDDYYKEVCNKNKELEEERFKLQARTDGLTVKLANSIPKSLYEDVCNKNKELEEENKKLKYRLKEKICFEGNQQFRELQENSILKSLIKGIIENHYPDVAIQKIIELLGEEK